MILVTGATGFVGNHVARFLARRGERLRVLVRESSDRATLEGLEAEPCVGDLLDESSLRRAVRGCSAVFHVAAEYKLWSADPAHVYTVNVDGTRNMLEAARHASIERFVYTSSVGTIAPARDGTPVTEKSPSGLHDMTGEYKRSKYLAEQLARRAANSLDIVIVNPTAPVGERDFKPTPTGKIVLDFLEGRMPAYLDTGLNLVDVRDVARGHWLAAQRGRVGERYPLGAENMSLRRILETLAEISGRDAPQVRLPYLFAWMAGATCSLWSGISGKPPAIPIDGVRMARRSMYADCDKARRELGFNPSPVRDALLRAVKWFEEQAARRLRNRQLR